jgi:hypothetical protein
MKVRAYGICQRSGLRFYLDELVKDGYNPNLLVHPRYWEPAEKLRRYKPKKEEFVKKVISPEVTDTGETLSLPTRNFDTWDVMGAFSMTVSAGEVAVA